MVGFFKGFAFVIDPVTRRGKVIPAVDVSLIDSGIDQILHTTPGERVHEPGFGSLIRHKVFEPRDEFLPREIEEEIKVRINSVEQGRVQILKVETRFSPDDDHMADVKVTYALTENLKDIQEITFRIGLP